MDRKQHCGFGRIVNIKRFQSHQNCFYIQDVAILVYSRVVHFGLSRGQIKSIGRLGKAVLKEIP